MRVDPAYKHSELTETILGVFYSVYNELGYGFLESVYRNSLQMALREKGVKVEAEVVVPVFFQGKKVGDFKPIWLWNRAYSWS
jgi:GxxExxY protein